MNFPARVVDTQTLTAAVKGTVVRPGDSTYDGVRAIWNAMIDRRPAVIVRCADAADVVAAIAFAREQGLEISIRGGGHNIAGSSVCDGGVMIDLSQMTAGPRRRRGAARLRRAGRAARRRRSRDAGARPGDAARHQLDDGRRRVDAGRRLRLADADARADRRQPGVGGRRRRRRHDAPRQRRRRTPTCSGRSAAAAATSASSPAFEFALHPMPARGAGRAARVPDGARRRGPARGTGRSSSAAPESLNVWAVLRKAPPLPVPARRGARAGRGGPGRVLRRRPRRGGGPDRRAARSSGRSSASTSARRRTSAGSRRSIRCSRPARATTGSRTTSPS